MLSVSLHQPTEVAMDDERNWLEVSDDQHGEVTVFTTTWAKASAKAKSWQQFVLAIVALLATSTGKTIDHQPIDNDWPPEVTDAYAALLAAVAKTQPTDQPAR